MRYNVCITEAMQSRLYEHLFPGDGKEAVAIALCGRISSSKTTKLMFHKLLFIPHNECVRTESLVKWRTERIIPFLEIAMNRDMAIVKIHSHPGGYDRFSSIDDESDLDLFESVFGWTNSNHPHASLVMLPNHEMFGRIISDKLHFHPITQILIIGDDIRLSKTEVSNDQIPQSMRNRQLFGDGTIGLLNKLSVAVVGCSGTGSPVIEQLARLGIGKLVLVDPDKVEFKNLNRILNTKSFDVKNERYKVEVLKEAVESYGFDTEVTAYTENLYNDVNVLKEVATCDIIFGCVDSVDGRHLLNHLSSFYLIPYFDIGVKLVADGVGGIDQIAASVHYIQPGKSSLRTRGVYNEEDLRAAGMYRANPEQYKELLGEGYISNVNVERPAVISINMLIASIAINEFLARIHRFRYDKSAEFAITRISVTDGYMQHDVEGEPDLYFKKYVGRGDMNPLLNLPELNFLNDKPTQR